MSSIAIAAVVVVPLVLVTTVALLAVRWSQARARARLPHRYVLRRAVADPPPPRPAARGREPVSRSRAGR